MSTATIKKPSAKKAANLKRGGLLGSAKGLRIKPGVDLTKPTLKPVEYYGK